MFGFIILHIESGIYIIKAARRVNPFAKDRTTIDIVNQVIKFKRLIRESTIVDENIWPTAPAAAKLHGRADGTGLRLCDGFAGGRKHRTDNGRARGRSNVI